ncbi:MAG TPA: alpha/beta hydrolase [Thermomicrobiaceae bacterium]|nr:alpha/beta hydrolase [Thermomicrobiaceae bacterium]
MNETEVVEINGGPLAFDASGSGHPLILVHGGLGDRRMWDDQVETLAERFRVIRYDQRGYSDSPMPAGSVSYHEDLYGLLHALHIPQANVVGVSFGARVVTDFTLTHPEMVSSLISVSSVVGGLSDETKSRIAEADRAAEDGDLDRAVELELRIWIDGVGRLPEEVNPAVREKVRAMNRALWEQPDTDVETIDIDPPARVRLAEIEAPVLVVVGELDIPDVQATADLLLREIPDARRITIPRAAHHPHMEQPALFNRVVLDFLSTVSG